METSRPESSQDAVTPKNAKNFRLAQEAGTLSCKHCPFRTINRQSLTSHEKHHSANYPFQCKFCTFSSKCEKVLKGHHIKRVHQETLRGKRYLTQPVIVKAAINVKPTGEYQPENFSHPKKQVEQNNTPKTAAEVEMHDDEEEVFMMSEEELEEMSCLCGQPQPAYGDGSAFSCSQCDDRFHEYCVYITPTIYEQMDELEEPWICPHCVDKVPPITHETTLSQVVNTSAKQRPPSPRYTSPPHLAKSNDSYLEPQTLNENLATNIETHTTLLLPLDEEVYSSERSNLLLEIQSATEMIMDMKKSLKDETRELQMARSMATYDLRKKMEELEKEFHRQSVHLVVLKEQSESFHQKLNELTARKIELEQDIINLRQSSVGNKKIKLELMASESSSTDFGEEIRRKKQLLKDVKEKLPVVQGEKTQLATRIRGVDEEMGENTLKLAKMRDDLESLVGNSGAVTRPSALEVQLKALIGKQRIRIERFAWLEIKLAKINYKIHLDEIRKEKERWLDHLMDYNAE